VQSDIPPEEGEKWRPVTLELDGVHPDNSPGACRPSLKYYEPTETVEWCLCIPAGANTESGGSDDDASNHAYEASSDDDDDESDEEKPPPSEMCVYLAAKATVSAVPRSSTPCIMRLHSPALPPPRTRAAHAALIRH